VRHLVHCMPRGNRDISIDIDPKAILQGLPYDIDSVMDLFYVLKNLEHLNDDGNHQDSEKETVQETRQEKRDLAPSTSSTKPPPSPGKRGLNVDADFDVNDDGEVRVDNPTTAIFDLGAAELIGSGPGGYHHQ
jgi:hypothetical protein